MKEKLKFGWAEVSITPEKRPMLAGQFYPRISQYVETPITVTALAIEAGSEQAIFCSADQTHIYASITKGVRKILASTIPDFDANKLIINATHTHTAFDYADENGIGLDALEEYLGMQSAPVEGQGNILTDNIFELDEAAAFLKEKIAEAAAEAWKNRAPGGYSTGFGRAAVGMCRRVTYTDGTAQMWGDVTLPNFFALEGGNDNGIEMMFIYGQSDEPTGAILNIACPAQVLEQRYFVSSDYWGKVKILLRRRFGDDFKLLALCSPAGDQCPRDLVRWVEPETPVEDPNIIRNNPPIRDADPSMYDIRGSWTIGRRIASEVLAVYEEKKRTPVTEAEFGHIVEMMPLPLRRVTDEENEAARAALDAFGAAHKGELLTFKDDAAMHVHAGIAQRYDYQKTTSIVPTEVHVVRLGNVAFASDPFELFLDFANIIRAHSPARQTFLIQLANDALGYLPTEKAEKGGHYSAYVSSGLVGHEGGYMLAFNTLDDIKKLFEE